MNKEQVRPGADNAQDKNDKTKTFVIDFMSNKEIISYLL